MSSPVTAPLALQNSCGLAGNVVLLLDRDRLSQSQSTKGLKGPQPKTLAHCEVLRFTGGRRQSASPATVSGIQFETVVRGLRLVQSVAVGTAEQLVRAGLCGAEHLPQGRQRIVDGWFDAGPDRFWWTARRMAGGLIKLTVEHGPGAKTEAFASGFLAAQRALDKQASNEACAEFHRGLRSRICLAEYCVSSSRLSEDGMELDQESAKRLTQLQSEAVALLRRMVMVLDSAGVQVHAVDRAAYLDTLRQRMTLPMPSLLRAGGNE